MTFVFNADSSTYTQTYQELYNESVKKADLLMYLRCVTGNRGVAEVLFSLVKKASREYSFFDVAEANYKAIVEPGAESEIRNKLRHVGKFFYSADQILKCNDVSYTCRKSVYRALKRLEDLGIFWREKELKKRDRSQLPRHFKDTVNYFNINYKRLFELVREACGVSSFMKLMELIRPGINKYFYAAKIYLQAKVYKLRKNYYEQVKGRVSRLFCPMKERNIFLLKNNSSETRKIGNLEIDFRKKSDSGGDLAQQFKKFTYGNKGYGKSEDKPKEELRNPGGYRMLNVERKVNNSTVPSRNYSWERGEEVVLTEEEKHNPLFARLMALGSALNSKVEQNEEQEEESELAYEF